MHTQAATHTHTHMKQTSGTGSDVDAVVAGPSSFRIGIFVLTARRIAYA